MSIYDRYKTSKQLEQGGTWVKLGDAEFLIGRAGGANTKFAQAVERHTRNSRSKIKRGAMTEEETRAMARDIVRDGILFNWRNVKNQNDQTLEFTPENVNLVLNELPDLVNHLTEMAMEMDTFLDQDAKVDAKN